jgi:hypothetical protein
MGFATVRNETDAVTARPPPSRSPSVSRTQFRLVASGVRGTTVIVREATAYDTVTGTTAGKVSASDTSQNGSPVYVPEQRSETAGALTLVSSSAPENVSVACALVATPRAPWPGKLLVRTTGGSSSRWSPPPPEHAWRTTERNTPRATAEVRAI